MVRIRSLERRTERALSPVLGVLCLVALTVCLAAVIAAGLSGVGPTLSSSPSAAFDLAVDGDGTIELRHLGGDPVDVREVTVRVRVDGESLADQPPVPFFSVDGFAGGPEGPFNERADPTWSTGETASVRVAATNEPTIDGGETVEVTLAVDGKLVSKLEAEAT